MFERFIKNKMCVDIMMWLLNHSTGDYDAAIIAYDIQAFDVSVFSTAIYVLDQLGILDVDNNIEETNLRVIFNEDSVIVQSFRTLKECFDNEAYRNSNACSVLTDFCDSYDNYVNNEETLLSQVNSLSDEYIDTLLDMMENYKDVELSDDPEIAKKEMAVLEEARKLDDAGQLYNFINFINENRK